MDRKKIEEMTIKFVTAEMKLSDNDVRVDTNLEAIGADSLNVTDIVMEMEDAFGFEMDDESMQRVRSVSDLVNYAVQHAG